MTSGEFSEKFAHPDVDISFWESDIHTNEPVVGAFFPGAVEYQYAGSDSSVESAHKLLSRAFKDQEVYITSHTKDKKLLMVRVTSDINPGEYYIFNTETKRADFLWANQSWIDPRQMAKMEHIKLKARDGVDLFGLFTPPTKTINGKPPLLVIPHGGPHGVRDHWDFEQETQLLANRGYAVLKVNFRGSGGFGKKFERMGYKNWGGGMIDDILDATQWLVDQGKVDGNRMCIYGGSYGGYAAMMSTIRAPSLFKCVVGYVGVYDLNLMYSNGDIPDLWGGKGYLEKVLGTDEASLTANSPVTHASKITADVMIVHGVEDRRVPLKHARVMRKALRAAGKDPEWVIYDGVGHGVWNEEKRKDLYTRLLTFLDKNIGN